MVLVSLSFKYLWNFGDYIPVLFLKKEVQIRDTKTPEVEKLAQITFIYPYVFAPAIARVVHKL